MAIFPTFFFCSQYRPGKYLLRFFRTKNFFLGYKKKKFQTSKNWHFSKGVNPWFWSKYGHFSNFLFLCNTVPGNIFYDILERKNTSLKYKNKILKNSKNWHFSKGVNPCFWTKNGYFSNFFFVGNIGQEKYLSRFFRTKKTSF